MQTLWKQDAALHPTFVRFNTSLHEDWFLLPFELALQRAHAKTLAAAGILSDDEHAALSRAIDDIERSHTGHTAPASDTEDLHTWIEARLVDLAGPSGRKIHTARSRNDQVATLLTLYVISVGRRLETQLKALIHVCCLCAIKWHKLILPLQTHCQFAAPGSVGFWILRFAVAFDRVSRHVAFYISDWKTHCPLGSGAVAGTSIPIDRAIQAAELGFDSPSPNALDATTTRDACLELLSLASQTALHLQALATDVIVFSQTPFGWTEYPRAFSTGSSMMPNKSNPDAMELLRGESSSIPAALGHALLLLKGLPSGYQRDLQCIKPIVRDAAESLLALCAMAEAFLHDLDFNAERLSASLTMGAIDATLSMEQQVLAGASLRDAHHAVAAALRAPEGLLTGTGSPSMGADRYRSFGAASPAETLAVAGQILARLEKQKC